MSSFTNGSGSLRPTWSRNSGSQGGGRGFQPPPAVPPERPPEGRRRSGSQGSSGSGASGENRPTNKFAALDDGEDLPAESKLAQSQQNYRRSSTGPNKSSRGRSLADLAATVPDSSNGRPNFRSASRSESFSEPSVKVTRYTREKLLALRPRPDTEADAPDEMKKHLEGNPILSDAPLDPVCWDTFDSEEIWAQAMRERTTRSSSMTSLKTEGGLKPEVPPSRRASATTGFGKWQRGVALPPPDENSHRRGSSGRIDAENPNDLWDDPLASTEAAADFSAFGEIPDDGPKNVDTGDPFDFDKMAKQSQQFDDELRGNPRSSVDAPNDMNGEPAEETPVSVTVNPHRPLASIGTTIRSGSGEDVNVFEDFDDNPTPAAEATSASSAASEHTSVKSVDEDPTASSRLMKMIGVNREETSLSNEMKSSSLNPWASSDEPETQPSGISGAAVDIPSNPWGESILPGSAKNSQGGGFDLASRIEQATSEQTAREEIQRRHSQQEAERAHRMQEEERRAIEERQRQQEMQQQSAPSQVELVLMERISVILENSWGRSDLMSILNTLHSEDSRVIQLLGNIDALRSLISRHPRRIALRQDPAFGAEMAVLLLTNAQFQAQQQDQQPDQQQQQQQAEAQARAQQEEIARREQLIQTQQNQQRQNGTSIRIIPNQPWYYSDPQKNIQGPFRGEEMRQWLEAGYFKGDLPISQQTSGPFIPLSAIFPDMAFAFRVPEDENDERAAREEEKRAREEQEQRLTEEKEKKEAMAAAQREMELERQREIAQREIAQREMELQRERELELQRERELAEEREAKAAEEAQKVAMAHVSAQGDQNESSNQLKMMLGLGGGQQFNKSNDEQNLVEEPKAVPEIPAPQPVAVPAPAPAKPAWGSVVAGQAKRTKSMAEIQQEEARQAAIVAAQNRASGRSSSGGWANIAASRGGSSGWQGGAVKQATPAIVTGPNTMASAQAINTRPVPVKTVHRQSSAPSAMQPARRTSQSEPKPADDFGASMSTTLETWCKDQMRKLNGSDDLTLASFCMTLNDPAEIRQYLTAYLGSTPQVNNFATEFINKRGLGRNHQEEWESTKPKRGKKKGGK